MVYTDPAFVFVFAVLLVAAAVLRRQPRAKAALVAAFSGPPGDSGDERRGR